MNAEPKMNELEVLNKVRERYERQGYKFILEPSSDKMPEFLEGVRLDAIAVKGDKGIVFEVKNSLKAAENSALVKFLASEIPKHAGWNFELLLVESDVQDDLPSKNEIGLALGEVKILVREGNEKVAIIYAWGLLEAAVRKIGLFEATDKIKRYLPNTIVEQLVADGFVDDSTAELLRTAAKIRTALAHGMISTSVPAIIMSTLVNVIDELLHELPD